MHKNLRRKGNGQTVSAACVATAAGRRPRGGRAGTRLAPASCLVFCVIFYFAFGNSNRESRKRRKGRNNAAIAILKCAVLRLPLPPAAKGRQRKRAGRISSPPLEMARPRRRSSTRKGCHPPARTAPRADRRLLLRPCLRPLPPYRPPHRNSDGEENEIDKRRGRGSSPPVPRARRRPRTTGAS